MVKSFARQKPTKLLAVLAWLVTPALLRLLFMPLNHPWDIQTWYAIFADFKYDQSPYATMQRLSFEARAEMISPYYEYYAYPPGLIYLYYPIAKLYALFDPNLSYFIGRADSLFTFPVPLHFNYFFKVPIMLADLGIALLLWKMGGKSVAHRYAYSLYTIMIIVWMFDPLMVLCILGGLYALERGKLGQAAVALAIGTIIKFVPIIFIPALVLYFLRQNYSLAQIGRFCAIYTIISLILVAPFLEGMLFVLEFHSARLGRGMTWYIIFSFLPSWTPDLPSGLASAIISAGVGAIILPLGLLIIYLYAHRQNLTLRTSLIVTLLGYLACTKIVNEVYVLPLIPLILLELYENPSRLKEFYFKLFWAIPITWAIVSMPLFSFLLSPVASSGQLNVVVNLEWLILTDKRPMSLLLIIMGCGFNLLCITAIPVFAKREKQNDT
jgi:hypothetical protein